MNIEVDAVLQREASGLPRYTSYPPANHFVAGVGPQMLEPLLAATRKATSVSVYVHIPYCDRMCWFCGCHTKQTRQYEPVARYIDSLVREIGLWREKLGTRPKLSALHFGGGSPSLLRQAEWQKINQALRETFNFLENAEIAVELDPSDSTPDLIASLTAIGLTRASIGVQDFDPVVQAAINRPQSFASTLQLVNELRAAGVKSLNIDALYGLPLQTEQRFRRTLEKVEVLKPDRIALFGYAHVPWLKAHQRLINEADLPNSRERFDHAEIGREILTAAGYLAIGLDHFARPNDTLAMAAAKGRLVRNFQGYTTDEADVRLGLGPSAIGQFPDGFVQNEVATGQYARMVEQGQLPLSRGLAISREDQMYGYIISRLMCDFQFSFLDVADRFGAYSVAAIQLAKALAATELPDLCAVVGGKFFVKPGARPFVRLVASKFDQWLTRGQRQYSKVV